MLKKIYRKDFKKNYWSPINLRELNTYPAKFYNQKKRAKIERLKKLKELAQKKEEADEKLNQNCEVLESSDENEENQPGEIIYTGVVDPEYNSNEEEDEIGPTNTVN